MNMQQTSLALIGAVALTFSGAVLANQHAGSMDMHAESSDNGQMAHHEGTLIDIPAPKQAKGGFMYVTGGVGAVEQANMQARYADYSFELVNVLSGPQGAFVSDVHVTIKKNNQTVLETTTQGPWLMADLPPGTYQLTASFDGATQSNTIKLHKGANQRLVLDWYAD